MRTGVASAPATPDRTTLGAFALLILLAGGNGVAVRFVYEEFDPPFWVAGTRFLFSAIIFAVVSAVLRIEVPRGRALLSSVLYGVLIFGAGFGLIYRGLVEAPAGLTQVIIAWIPLLTVGLAVVHRLERFRFTSLAGAALAFGGVAIIFAGGIDQGVPLGSLLAIVAGSICWAEGAVVVKALPPVHPAMMNTIAMAVGTAILLVASFVAGESRPMPRTGQTWVAQTYLVLIGSVAVFALVLFVLRRWTASAASYQYPLFPLVTVALSAWLQDERITWSFALGSVLVLAGVYFGALRRPTET